MDTNFSDRIKRFFSGNMSPEEQQQFDQDLQQNEQLAQEMAEHLATNALLKGYQNQKEEDELIAALRKRRKKRRFFFVFSLLIVVTIVALRIDKNTSTDEPTPNKVPLSFFFEIPEMTTPDSDETPQEPIIGEPDETTEPTSSNPAPPPVEEPKEIIPIAELPEPIAIWEREVIEEQLFLRALAGNETGATLDTFDKLQIIFKNSTIAEYPTILTQGPRILPNLEIAEQKQLQLLIAATYYRLNQLENALAFAKLAGDQNTACCYILAIKLQVVSFWRLGRREASRGILEKLAAFPIPTIRQQAEALLSEI